MIPYCSDELDTHAKHLIEPALEHLDLPGHVIDAIEYHLDDDEYITALQTALYYH